MTNNGVVLPPGLYPPSPPAPFTAAAAAAAMAMASATERTSLTPSNGSAESSPTTTTTMPPTTQSLEAALKSGQGNAAALNIQTMQLEWLARTGMLYQRFPELAGRSPTKYTFFLAKKTADCLLGLS